MTGRWSRLWGKGFAIAAACALAAVIVGCGQPAQNVNEQQDPARLYKNEVSAAASDLALHLEAFNEAVETGNVYTMHAEADDAFKSIDQLTAISAPDAFSEAQQDYVTGCNDLKAALNSYLDVYSAMENATDDHPFDYASYEGQLQSIQDQYSAGIAALQAGDQKTSAN